MCHEGRDFSALKSNLAQGEGHGNMMIGYEVV